MPKRRNPPQNFIIKGNAVHLTGAKKKLSQAEEDQLRDVLTQRRWNKFCKNLRQALRNFNQNRRQSVTDTTQN